MFICMYVCRRTPAIKYYIFFNFVINVKQNHSTIHISNGENYYFGIWLSLYVHIIYLAPIFNRYVHTYVNVFLVCEGLTYVFTHLLVLVCVPMYVRTHIWSRHVLYNMYLHMCTYSMYCTLSTMYIHVIIIIYTLFFNFSSHTTMRGAALSFQPKIGVCTCIQMMWSDVLSEVFNREKIVGFFSRHDELLEGTRGRQNH